MKFKRKIIFYSRNRIEIASVICPCIIRSCVFKCESSGRSFPKTPVRTYFLQRKNRELIQRQYTYIANIHLFLDQIGTLESEFDTGNYHYQEKKPGVSILQKSVRVIFHFKIPMKKNFIYTLEGGVQLSVCVGKRWAIRTSRNQRRFIPGKFAYSFLEATGSRFIELGIGKRG